ncbi:tRNA lysidine(34) synthetase TilS [Gilvimarinus sp. SDUM040013]|uniref:tRNA(Ile)-lysidine synthase n=1 Tax=Gilvimarinus gilvus TaxID=3058038 RepID=A0ABU4S0T1_9GAMM|nr:tRNA lysidine(34) synthetase TilS [Gilvimarinus sp. SDUM040013]MDO3384497.1 tRNA lysidine(34) synthetase TilS [Gilvimarinus sp. SDUM040013]MDX6850738.1 tRNA lysidine(34) synthetase TilS [Gilvimarinus sp. SDUM040013]
MTQQTVNHIQQLLIEALPANSAGRWLVGLSGGLDSTVLLHALTEVAGSVPIVAVHINHGLSVNADEWQRHCESVCRELGVELLVERVNIAGEGAIEERARKARLKVFQGVMSEGDILLLAHHRQDQAETVLFRLLRGAGVTGLGGIRAQRSFAGGSIVRPLLAAGRPDLEAYARAQKLAWVEDESNTDTAFDRNFLRRDILPKLRTRWPEADDNVARAARHCSEADALLQELAELDLATMAERAEPMGFSLDLVALSQLSVARQRNLLRYWLQQRFAETAGYQLLADIETQLIVGNSPESQVQGKRTLLRQFQGRLYGLSLAVHWAPGPGELSLQWSEPAGSLALPGDDWLCWQNYTVGEPLEVSSSVGWGRALARQHLERAVMVNWRSGSERCQPAGRRHSQTLKRLLQEYQLPPWLRARLPLVYIDNELAAVANLWVCEAFAANPGDEAVILQWQFPQSGAASG